MRPGVVSVAEDPSLHQVQRAMVAHDVHAVLITAAGGPAGASARDALRMLAAPGVGHLLVSPRTATSPQGVVSEIDLARLASGG